ncbi:exopolysaccharide biosynthesis polyprenyl glycosylphosphotransferase [Flavobacterium sp.]|uniref:exopolysaccharide biosynthesis polyprenyl glycosylphosphotransferase n=1 Tax=Flavobacterium sp. TaxID=239 RepID=UPI002611CFC7|nr:exopolysaccharide biosynthesis polyprenyl glycosylphosphotransferase [Flavobacterium sp.]
MRSGKEIHFEISERKILLRLFDVLSIVLSLYAVDYFFNFNYFNFTSQNFYWIVVLGLYVNILGTVFEMYNLQVASNQFQVIRSIVLTSCTTALFYLLTPVFTPFLPLSRLQIVYFFLAIFGGLLAWRIFYQAFLASYRFEKKVVLICDREEVEELVTGLENIDPHYRIIGYINSDITHNDSFRYDYVTNLDINEFDDFVKNNSVSEIVIASQKTDGMTVPLYNKLLYLLESGYIIREYTQVYETITQRIPIQHFDKDFYRYFPFSRSNQNKLYLLVVRILEIILSLAGLTIGLLLLPFILLGNLLGNSGKLFYLQTRVGKNGIPFVIYKLRTMVKNAEKDGAVFTTNNDIRVTPFGKFLRKARIDEIPQFINILKGDMGFIGPRPERPVFVQELAEVMPFYDTRHVIKPGLTGWAQVNYAYGETMADSLIKLQYDLYYIKHRSVFLDLNILIKTFSTVLFYRGQ